MQGDIPIDFSIDSNCSTPIIPIKKILATRSIPFITVICRHLGKLRTK